jgi:hypothetical protein
VQFCDGDGGDDGDIEGGPTRRAVRKRTLNGRQQTKSFNSKADGHDYAKFSISDRKQHRFCGTNDRANVKCAEEGCSAKRSWKIERGKWIVTTTGNHDHRHVAQIRRRRFTNAQRPLLSRPKADMRTCSEMIALGITSKQRRQLEYSRFSRRSRANKIDGLRSTLNQMDRRASAGQGRLIGQSTSGDGEYSLTASADKLLDVDIESDDLMCVDGNPDHGKSGTSYGVS